MRFDDLTSLLWRRKWVALLTLLACLGAVIAVTSVLPRTYEATATLFVAGPEDVPDALDTTQGEQLARPYTALASTPAVADGVLKALDDGSLDREELLGRMSFAPVERTQLLNVTA